MDMTGPKAVTWLQVGSKDRASHILTAPFERLEEDEKMLRYFIRFSNLSGKVSPTPLVQGYLAYQKPPPRRTLWKDHA